MQTEVHNPPNTTRFLPMRLISSITAASSQVFIEVRSSIGGLPNGSHTSSNIGPEKLFSATVVRIVGTLNPAAAAAISPALLRSTSAGMDFVAKAICDG